MNNIRKYCSCSGASEEYGYKRTAFDLIAEYLYNRKCVLLNDYESSLDYLALHFKNVTINDILYCYRCKQRLDDFNLLSREIFDIIKITKNHGS